MTHYTRHLPVDNTYALICILLAVSNSHRRWSWVRGITRYSLLKQHHLGIEIVNINNPNKNPVAERAAQELEKEILKHEPTGGPVYGISVGTLYRLSVKLSDSQSRSVGLRDVI